MATIEPRKHKNGTSYRAVIRIKGYPKQQKTFNRITDAKLWALQTEASIRRGELNTILKKVENKPFKYVVERYKDEILLHKHKNTILSETSHLKFWESIFGDYDLVHISPALISENLTKLSKSKSPSTGRQRSKRTIKYYRDTLSTVFKYAIEWGYARQNPVDDVAPITKLRNERVRYLSNDERTALLAACKENQNKQLYPLVIMALATGARQGELLGLHLSDVDLATGKIVFRNTKNTETRSVTVGNYALDIVKDQAEYAELLYFDFPKNHHPRLFFPRNDGQKAIEIKKAWYQALKASEVTDFKFHDLRHSAASYLAMNGATLIEIAAILGHKTLAMVKRYAHLSEDHTKEVLAKMNDRIF